jgi:hypothetical protein
LVLLSLGDGRPVLASEDLRHVLLAGSDSRLGGDDADVGLLCGAGSLVDRTRARSTL